MTQLIGCVLVTDVRVIVTIRSYENREKVWGGLSVRSVQPRGRLRTDTNGKNGN